MLYRAHAAVCAHMPTHAYMPTCLQATREAFARVLPNCQPADLQWVCATCASALKKGKIPSASLANNMAISPIPPELACLTPMEARLISKVTIHAASSKCQHTEHLCVYLST